MKRIILHIGPGKCGSTSIQSFFGEHSHLCNEKVGFRMLNPQFIVQLEENNQEAVKIIVDLIENFTWSEVLILSSELLRWKPTAIKNIMDVAKKQCEDVRIIGYSRRQSDWMISAYGQWGFRIKDKIDNNNSILKSKDLTPSLFSCLEQDLMAAILSNFFRNHCTWEKVYEQIEQKIGSKYATIKVGVLPNRVHKFNLIEDFCKKADLTLKQEGETRTKHIENPRFNDRLVEAIGNATAFDLEVPKKDDHNSVLFFISAQMEHIENKTTYNDFLTTLKQHIDACFLPSNQRFCQKYGLDESYFAAGDPHPDIIGYIKEENDRRLADAPAIIEEYKLLSGIMAETCFKLAKKVVSLENKKRQYVEIISWRYLAKKAYTKLISYFKR